MVGATFPQLGLNLSPQLSQLNLSCGNLVFNPFCINLFSENQKAQALVAELCHTGRGGREGGLLVLPRWAAVYGA